MAQPELGVLPAELHERKWSTRRYCAQAWLGMQQGVVGFGRPTHSRVRTPTIKARISKNAISVYINTGLRRTNKLPMHWSGHSKAILMPSELTLFIPK